MKPIKVKLNNPNAKTPTPCVRTSSAGTADANTSALSSDASMRAPTAPTSSFAANYNGVPYEKIYDAWLGARGITGDVGEGARNQTLYQLARDMRYIMDFNPAQMLGELQG